MNTKMLLTASCFSMLLLGCNQEPAQSPLETNTEQASYIIGYSSIKQMVDSGAYDLDNTAFLNGVQDALASADSKLSPEVTKEAMQQFQEEMQAKAKLEQDSVAADNLAAGLAYMAENATKEGVIVDPAGFQYKILTEGTGPKPASEASTVKVNYEGKVIDGTVFDSSYERGEPIEFALNRVISGWTKAVQLMPEGSTWEVTIPPELGYGAGGAGGAIGPNATLIFKIELIKADAGK